MLRGIVRYARLHGPWSFYITPGDFEQALPRIQQWGGAGIIARVETAVTARELIKSKVPTIILDAEPKLVAEVPELGKLSEVRSDSEGAARIAAQHLLERGFENFAFIGLRGRVWSDLRCEAFAKSVRGFGFDPDIYQQPRRKADRVWEREQTCLADWIRDLPKPVGIMACDDDRGHEVLEACRIARVNVPEEVAVIGVDDDELFCELADPPLSSVAFNSEHGGYRTAQLLDQLMHDRIQTPQKLIVEATQVHARRSTDVKVFDGPEVSAALSFIHRNRSKGFTIDDVANAVGISRRTLEVKFRKSVGRTILSEVQRIRLDHVKHMLRETDLSIPRIAEASGFNSASYLTQVFRKEFAMSPVKYRSKFRV
jgi:LacI family transcriptional regulator